MLRHVEGPDRERLTAQEVADELRLSLSTLKELIREGRFPRGVKPGGKGLPTWPWLDVVAFAHLSGRLALSESQKGTKKMRGHRKAPEGKGGQGRPGEDKS